MEDSLICPICGCQFRPKESSQTKCVRCEKEHPNEANLQEILDKKNPQRPDIMTEAVVRRIAYEVLEEAGIKRVKCEKCSRMFFKKSPAHKLCEICKK